MQKQRKKGSGGDLPPPPAGAIRCSPPPPPLVSPLFSLPIPFVSGFHRQGWETQLGMNSSSRKLGEIMKDLCGGGGIGEITPLLVGSFICCFCCYLFVHPPNVRLKKSLHAHHPSKMSKGKEHGDWFKANGRRDKWDEQIIGQMELIEMGLIVDAMVTGGEESEFERRENKCFSSHFITIICKFTRVYGSNTESIRWAKDKFQRLPNKSLSLSPIGRVFSPFTLAKNL